MRRILILLILIVPAALLAPRGAFAHASLVASDPVTGAVVAEAPASVGLIFNEPVAPLAFHLLGPDGAERALEPARSADRHVTVDLPPNLLVGTYWLGWRAVSEDGHPIHGTLSFSIGKPGGMGRPDVGADLTLATAIWLSKLGLYLGLFLGVGGAFFALVIAGGSSIPPVLHRVLPGLLGTGLLSAILAVGLQGLDALGLPFGGLGSSAAWAAGWSTSFGGTALLAAVAMVLALLALRTSIRALAVVAIAILGLALAASGHAAAAEPRWLMRPLVLVHGVSIALWIGALLPLALVLRTADGLPALLRFSRAIPFVLAVLLVTGAAIAVVQLGRPEALWTTPYGRILSIKLGVVTLLLGFALLNRVALTGPVAKGDARAYRWLRRSIIAEIVLALTIFGLAAGWRFTPPPRSLPPEPASIEIHLHGERAMAEVTVELRPDGRDGIDIVPLDANGVPFQPLEVHVRLAPGDGSIESARQPAELSGEGWHLDAPGLRNSDVWRIQIDLLVTDFDLVRLDGSFSTKAASGPP